MTQPSKLPALRAHALEIEAQVSHLCADLRETLAAAEEEERRLRLEAERFNLEVFTEDEAAERFGISPDTLARLRTSLHLPHLRVGVQIRYANFHLVEITGLLEKRQGEKKGKQARQLRTA